MLVDIIEYDTHGEVLQFSIKKFYFSNFDHRSDLESKDTSSGNDHFQFPNMMQLGTHFTSSK